MRVKRPRTRCASLKPCKDRELDGDRLESSGFYGRMLFLQFSHEPNLHRDLVARPGSLTSWELSRVGTRNLPVDPLRHLASVSV